MLSWMLTNIFSIPGHDPHSGLGEQLHVYVKYSGVQQDGNVDAHPH